MDGCSLLHRQTHTHTHTTTYCILLGQSSYQKKQWSMNLADINIPQCPASCLLLQTILIPGHGLSSRTLKSAGSRYVLWAMCHLEPPAHPNRWWNEGAEAITIKAEDMLGLAAGLAAPGKAKSVAWFRVKRRKCSQADSRHTRAVLTYGGQKGYQQAK